MPEPDWIVRARQEGRILSEVGVNEAITSEKGFAVPWPVEREVQPRSVLLFLPWPPTNNSYYRHTGNKVLLCKAGRAYRKAVVTAKKGSLPWNFPALARRLRVKLVAFPPDKRKRDLDNLFKSVLDSLEFSGIILNDGLIDDLSIVRREPIQGGMMQVQIEEMA